MNTINIFDWDDNILFMPTTIKMLHLVNNEWYEVEVSNNDFKTLREFKDYKLSDDPFIDFKDNHKFEEDVKTAVKERAIGPSFDDFKNVLIKGKKFAIITARGHSRKTIMHGIVTIINNLFTTDEINNMINNVGDIDLYLRDQYTYAVDSPDFKKEFFGIIPESQELWLKYNNKNNLKKVMALEEYIKVRKSEIGPGKPIKIFFSDDDLNNVKEIYNYLKTYKLNNLNVSFTIYDTSTGLKKEIN